ncbi:MAG: hypothetical protein J2P37_03915 [Ktedonobacteraceae bacterium]|nr:hypothetical protein [Ktedonobacteraceae bacterium]MBO0790481.1 hypothetical protein [Ktedonobacteraceae bacterium]
MLTINEMISRDGRTIETVAAYVQQYVDEHYAKVMQEHRETLEEIRARVGDPAYARYAQELFRPVYDELKQAGLICDPALPGTFPLSREQWGPEDKRERRFWCVLREEDGTALGTLITRFFHDHTRLRIPHQPTILAFSQINQSIIAQKVESSAIPGL